MKHLIDIQDDDLVYISSRVDRFLSVLEAFKSGSITIFGRKVISWEVGK